MNVNTWEILDYNDSKLYLKEEHEILIIDNENNKVNSEILSMTKEDYTNKKTIKNKRYPDEIFRHALKQHTRVSGYPDAIGFDSLWVAQVWHSETVQTSQLNFTKFGMSFSERHAAPPLAPTSQLLLHRTPFIKKKYFKNGFS